MPPDGDAPADHHDVRSAQGHAVAAEQLHDAARGARQGRGDVAGDLQHQPAQVRGVQAVGVLARIHGLEHRLLVQPGGQRQLDDVAGARRVVVEPGHGGEHVGLRGGRGQVLPHRRDADLGAVAVLARHVRRRPRVLTDQQRAQARHHATLAQHRHTSGELVADGRRGRLPVEQPSRHRLLTRSGRRWRRAGTCRSAPPPAHAAPPRRRPGRRRRRRCRPPRRTPSRRSPAWPAPGCRAGPRW